MFDNCFVQAAGKNGMENEIARQENNYGQPLPVTCSAGLIESNLNSKGEAKKAGIKAAVASRRRRHSAENVVVVDRRPPRRARGLGQGEGGLHAGPDGAVLDRRLRRGPGRLRRLAGQGASRLHPRIVRRFPRFVNSLLK